MPFRGKKLLVFDLAAKPVLEVAVELKRHSHTEPEMTTQLGRFIPFRFVSLIGERL